MAMPRRLKRKNSELMYRNHYDSCSEGDSDEDEDNYYGECLEEKKCYKE
jgi:hypothetical protein